MSSPKHFDVEQTDGICIISPIGSIGALEEAIRDEWAGVLASMEAAGTERVVIDLKSLDYFGSIVLELVVVLWKRLSGKGGRLVFCNVSPVGLDVLQAAKFDTIWPIVPSRQEAIDAVQA